MKVFMYCCLATLLVACGPSKENKNQDSMKVKTAQATLLTADDYREFRFISQPLKTTDLSFRVSGPIDRFDVYSGNFYRRGEQIAGIDARDFRIRQERAEAIYNQAKAEFGRIETLYKKDNLSASSYEKARADYTTAKTAFQTTTNELNDTRLLAPFDGYVSEVFIEKYQDVKATQPILSFIDISQLKIEAYVTQDIAFSAHTPAEVSLRFDANPDTTYSAKVAELSKSTTRNNLSYLLTALLPNPDKTLLGGMSGTVYLKNPTATNNATITIPQTALCHRPTEGDFVWVINTATGQVSQRSVTMDELLPNGRIALNSGLQANETIVTSRLRFLSDGMKVEILKEEPATTQK